MKELTKQNLAEFRTALASEDSVPGGGGAAAYASALGSALCAMAGRLTIGKKKYEQYWEDLAVLVEKADAYGKELLAMVEEDAECFAPLAAAYSTPKDDPERVRKLESATLKACSVPIRMTETTAKVIEVLEEMSEKSSRLLVSDVGCGSILCAAGLRCAALNVFVNTKTLKDREKAREINDRVRFLLAEYVPRARRTADAIEKELCPDEKA